MISYFFYDYKEFSKKDFFLQLHKILSVAPVRTRMQTNAFLVCLNYLRMFRERYIVWLYEIMP